MGSTRTMLQAGAWLLAACLLAVPAAAQRRSTDVIATGERDRPYYTYGTRLVNMLTTFRLQNQATKGSVENLELLAGGRATLGFVQLDVYAAALRRDAKRYASLSLIGHLIDECVFIAHRRGGGVPDLAALGRPIDGRPARLAVGDAGSGMASSWELLSTLDPTLAEARVEQRGGVLAVNQLSLGLLDAVGWVNDPRDLDHAMLRAVLDAPDLALLAVGEKFAYSLDNGTVIYEVRDVPLAAKLKDGGPTIQTVCTSAGVFAREDENPRLVEAASRALRFQHEALVRRDGS